VGDGGWVDELVWDLLLRQNYGAVLASDADGHDVGGGDSFEGILYKRRLAEVLSALVKLEAMLL